MARSQATTVEQYLDELPPERREVVAAVRDVVLRNLPEGYQEAMNWGMISYEVPLETHAETYNGQPLSYLGLAAQKNYYALYLMAAYENSPQYEFIASEFKKAGKKLDMGKSCLRFRKLDDLPLESIGKVIADVPPEKLIELQKAARKR
jgi:uncharacterized protein YdhG (YjbR/CyaY superfamily)